MERGGTRSPGIPPRLERLLAARPVRREGGGLRWEVGPDGIVVVTHPKDLTRAERWLMRRVGGSPDIRRRLDGPGSRIWLLCDGRHTIAEICDEMDRRYREAIEPVLTRVTRFLEMLLARNLIYLRSGEAPGAEAAPAATGATENTDIKSTGKQDEAENRERGEQAAGGERGR
ncbi:MAG: PqqD family protein [Thermoplasmatota archaeon]